MVDINEALMRRMKTTPVKRKQPTKVADKVKPSTSVTGLFKRSRPLDELSEPATKKQRGGTHPSSPSTSGSHAMFLSPQATAPTRQAYIDLGQKDFGRHITCRKCGLLYTAGEEEDEKEHRRFCRDRQRGVTVPKWKNERQLKSFSEHDARIIEIRKDDAPLHVKKLMEVKEVLDDAFGFVEKDEFLERGHFLFVQAKQIVGCVTVERITKATVLEQHAKKLTPSSTEPSSSDSPRESSQEVPAVLGICQLWVHPQHRGKKIATRLIDVVREKYIYGLLIAKHRIAFAQPTRNGLAFAKAYVTPHRVLVYGATLPNSPSAPSSSSTTPTSSVKRTLLH